MKKTLFFLCILLVSCGDEGSNLQPPANKGLSLFVIDQSQLPAGLNIDTVDPANTFCNFVQNPQLSREPSFAECIAGMMIGDTMIVKGKVIEALHLVFKDIAEIGITGFQFSDSAFAAKCDSIIINEHNFYTVRKNCIVVAIWDDGVSQANYTWIKAFVDSKSMELNP